MRFTRHTYYWALLGARVDFDLATDMLANWRYWRYVYPLQWSKLEVNYAEKEHLYTLLKRERTLRRFFK